MRRELEVIGNGSGSCGCAGGGGAASGPSRRDFLKVVGITGAGAAISGCGPPDVAGKLIPRLVQEEELVPGTFDTYPTALVEAGGEVLGVHARVRDGRVVKLEGNPDFPTNRGRLSALAQSALQDLYDPDRVRTSLVREASGPRLGGEREGDPADRFRPAEWEEAVAAAGEAVSGGGVVLVTGGVTGTSDRFFDEWAVAADAEYLQWEAFPYAAELAAHRLAFGRDEIPSYRLEEADRLVSFGADFLETWLAPVELAGRFAGGREVEEGRFAEFTFVGPRLSLTGMQADEWLPTRPGTEGLAALAVAHEVAGLRGRRDLLEGSLGDFAPERVAEACGVPAERLRDLAEELAAASSPLALPPGAASRGVRATEAHLAVAILNAALGAAGRALRFGEGPVRPRTATHIEMARLAERMAAGEVRTLVVTGGNPVFTVPASLGFAEALESVEHVIAIGPHLDETAAAADRVLPCHHALEAWGDAEVGGGARALAQPAMRPIFDTRQREDILLQVGAAAGLELDIGAPDFPGYLKNAWREILGAGPGFEERWRRALRRGGLYGEEAGTGAEAQEPAAGPAGPAGAAPSEAAAPSLTPELLAYRFEGVTTPTTGATGATGAEGAGETSLVVYPTSQFYDGRGANRSWIQELPDPVTQVVWNSWVELHPETAERLGVGHGDLVEVTTEAGRLTAPAYLYRGIREDAVALPIGQGHSAYGRHARGRGVNPLDLLPAETDPESGVLAFAGAPVRLRAAGGRGRLVSTQGSDTDLGREIAEIAEFDEVRAAIESHQVDLTELVEAAWDSDPQSPYRWGMTIDLNACIGCGACVTACHAENNVPTVGEELAAQGREMSWIRVQRFFEERADGGFETVHQPMLCQHCGDAPCEPVCPVYAAYHTPEGLNAQVYNRCVGTRYCANNCPYKVRRFNWFTYDFPYPLNLQLNPDVTVREKGVMEKCTFCVQRIQRAKLDAKEEGRTVRDGEVTTACQQTCPTQAITFGNLKDPESEVSRRARSARGYGALAELGTRPAVIYLEDVTHAELAAVDHGPGHGPADHGDDRGPGRDEGHGEEEGGTHGADGHAEEDAG